MTTNRVAEVAGVSIGSLYQYFPNKEALLGAVFERHQTRVRDAIGADFDDADDLRSFSGTRRLIEAIVQAHAIEPRLHARLEYLRRDGVLPSDLSEDHFGFVAGKLELALAMHFPDTVEDTRRSAHILVTTVHALVQAHEEGEIPCSTDTLIDEMTRLVFRYVGPTPMDP